MSIIVPAYDNNPIYVVVIVNYLDGSCNNLCSRSRHHQLHSLYYYYDSGTHYCPPVLPYIQLNMEV